MIFVRPKNIVLGLVALVMTSSSALAIDPIDYSKYKNESIGTFPITIQDNKVFVLLGLRQPKDKPTGTGLTWDWIGGVIGEGEGPLDAFSRELEEEIGPAAAEMLDSKNSASAPHIALFNESKKSYIWTLLKLVSKENADLLVNKANAYLKQEYIDNPNRRTDVSYPIVFEWVPVEYMDQMIENAKAAKKASGKFMDNMKAAAGKTIHIAQLDSKPYPTRFFLSILSTNPHFSKWFNEAKSCYSSPEQFSSILPEDQ
jgi:8-oxo-dGTP pyrophosphatase MutT (NUDIX family)